MEKQELNNYLLDKQLRQEAMKEISRSFPLTNEMLNEFSDELDWKEVSRNGHINWTAELIERWAHHIDWFQFSHCANERILTPNIIERFKDKWNWEVLSGNGSFEFSCELIDKYIDRWDWHNLIEILFDGYPSRNTCNNGFKEVSPREFFERYHEHIPMDDDFEDSPLWVNLVYEEQKKIERQLVEETQLNGFQETRRR